MRKTLLLLILLFPVILFAQGGTTVPPASGNFIGLTQYGSTVPANPCVPGSLYNQTTNNLLYSCPTGTWIVVTGNSISYGSGAPVGSCTAGTLYVNNSNGNIYTCSLGVWIINVTSGTPGQPAVYTGTNTIGSSALSANTIPVENIVSGLVNSLATDNGTTFTYSGTGGYATVADGVHAGIWSLVGNTTAPVIPANAWGFIGPNLASFTSWFIQPSSTPPSASCVPLLAAASSNVSAMTCSTAVGTDTGIPTAATISSTAGTPVCSTANGGVTTTACGAGNVEYNNNPTSTNPTAAAGIGQNVIKLWSFYVPSPGVKFSNFIGYYLTAADNSANQYDIGAYGPGCLGAAANVPLVFHIGPTAGTVLAPSTGLKSIAASGTLAAGWYCFAQLGSAAAPAMVMGAVFPTIHGPFAAGTTNATVGGATLPGTITAPATSWTNQPGQISVELF